MLRVVAVVLMVFAGNAVGEMSDDEVLKMLEQQRLFARCFPMDFAVEDISLEGSSATGLTRKHVVKVVESGLQKSGLYLPITKQLQEQTQYLHVNVSIVDEAFGVRLSFMRHLDLGWGSAGFVVVWRTGWVGAHDNDGDAILNMVASELNRFVSLYLRANGDEYDPYWKWCELQPGLQRLLRENAEQTPEEAKKWNDFGRKQYEEEVCFTEEMAFGEGNAISPWCN